MNRLPRLRLIPFAKRRRFLNLRPWLEGLEDRTVLSTITWSTTAAPNGGNWDIGGNWQGGVAPGPSDTTVIKGLASPGAVYLDTNKADSISGLTTDSTTNLEVI
jgi:hypothetical protein